MSVKQTHFHSPPVMKRIPENEHQIPTGLICDKAVKIINKLVNSGFEAYLVGGAVRDLMLGMEPKDFDIATDARPEEIRKLFPSCRLIGRRFRLAHIYFGRHYLEVATFRAPHDNQPPSQGSVNRSNKHHQAQGLQADDGRILQDNVYGTLEEDVWRRDFTINALLYDVHRREVIDYVGGADDLKSRTIRMIGDAEERYREDPVRMLRAIRFAAKLDFNIETQTGKIIPELSELLASVSPARLFDEVLKLLHGGKAETTLGKLREYGLFYYLFPKTEKQLEKDDEFFARFVSLALQNTDNRVQEGKSVNPAFLYAVMLWREAQAISEGLRELGCPNLQSYQIAATDIFKEQVQYTAIPKRNSVTTRDIWSLQTRFEFKDCRRSRNFLTHPRFRAAYDFMCLRAQAGEEDMQPLCDWWTRFQAVDDDEKQVMCEVEKSNRRKKRRRKKKNN